MSGEELERVLDSNDEEFSLFEPGILFIKSLMRTPKLRNYGIRTEGIRAQDIPGKFCVIHISIKYKYNILSPFTSFFVYIYF